MGNPNEHQNIYIYRFGGGSVYNQRRGLGEKADRPRTYRRRARRPCANRTGSGSGRPARCPRSCRARQTSSCRYRTLNLDFIGRVQSWRGALSTDRL